MFQDGNTPELKCNKVDLVLSMHASVEFAGCSSQLACQAFWDNGAREPEDQHDRDRDHDHDHDHLGDGDYRNSKHRDLRLGNHVEWNYDPSSMY